MSCISEAEIGLEELINGSGSPNVDGTSNVDVIQEQAIDLPGICNPLYLKNGRQVKGN